MKKPVKKYVIDENLLAEINKEPLSRENSWPRFMVTVYGFSRITPLRCFRFFQGFRVFIFVKFFEVLNCRCCVFLSLIFKILLKYLFLL